MQKKWWKKYLSLCRKLLKKINSSNLYLILLILTSLKIILSFYLGDHVIVEEWAILRDNLIEKNIFSYHYINGENIPSVYMPPLYAYFVYYISILNFNEFVTVKIILIFQCILSGISIIYFFKILKKFFNEKISLYFSLIYFLYPLNFYSATQISSVSIQVSLFIFFLYFYLKAVNHTDFFLLGLFSGLMTLIRGEFWLLLIILFLFKIFKKNFSPNNFCITLISIFIIITPYLIRNYINFNQIILTKSSGYNLWRGNSKTFNINGEHQDTKQITDFKFELQKKLIERNQLNKYEILIDEYYLSVAQENILKEPTKYLIHYFKKAFAFIFFNPFSNYPNYYNPLVFIPEIIISIIAAIGFFRNLFSTQRNLEIILITMYYLSLIPIFFVLPRYKLFVLPLYFIFAAYFLTFLSNKIFSKKQ